MIFVSNAHAGGIISMVSITSNTDLVAGETITIELKSEGGFQANALDSIVWISSTGQSSDNMYVTIYAGDLVVTSETAATATVTVPNVPVGTVYTPELHGEFGPIVWWGGACDDGGGGTADECKFTTQQQVTTGGLTVHEEKEPLIVGPNPATSNIKLSVNNTAVSIFSSNGKTILSQDLTTGTIDVSGLPNGTYILYAEDRSALFIKE